MPDTAFVRALHEPGRFSVLVEFTCAPGRPPDKLLAFLEAHEKRRPTWDKTAIAAVTVTHNPSGVVTALPTDVLGQVQLRGGLRGLPFIPHVSAKGMNLGELETFLQSLLSLGCEDCFLVTGDQPEVGKPVFEVDSLALLLRLRRMNADAWVAAGPKNPPRTLSPGVAVGLAKYEEAACLQQLIKLEKKIHAGNARFVITNLVFDARKAVDFFRYLKERELDVPVIGNVFFLTEAAARRMLGERLAGCYVSDALYERVRKESYEDWVERAALQVAMWRDLGAAGVDLGNVEELELACKILDRAAEIGPDWRKSDERISFPPPMENPFYLYTPDGVRTELREPSVPLRRLFMKWTHNLFFEPGTPGYRMIKTLFEHSRGIKNGEGLLYEATRLVEYIGKHSAARCRACGDCFLPENFFVCLMGECTKGLPNVPCGDATVDGRCGADTNKVCAGRQVYDAARRFSKELDALRAVVNPPRDPGLDQTSSFRSFFLELDHRRHVPLVRVAELVHATIPNMKRAFEIVKSAEDGFAKDNPGLEYLCQVIESQAFHQPDYIDVNVDDAGGGDPELASRLMRNTIRLVCERGGGIPPCVDSSDAAVIRAGVEEYYRVAGEDAPPPLVNSANKERTDFVWDLQRVGPFRIVYMLMGGALGGMDPGAETTPEELEEAAVGFMRQARAHGFAPDQVFYDTTVMPLAVEFSRFGQPGFNYVSLNGIRRIRANPELKGCHCILGITNLTRDFPAGRKVGLLRAYLHLAMEAGLSAAIVDVRGEYGIKPPDDEEIVAIVRAFLDLDGSPEAYERMQDAYEKYRSFGPRKPAAS